MSTFIVIRIVSFSRTLCVFYIDETQRINRHIKHHRYITSKIQERNSATQVTCILPQVPCSSFLKDVGSVWKKGVKQTEKKPQVKACSQLLSTLHSQGALLSLSEKPQVMQQNWPLNRVEEEVWIWVGHQTHFCLVCILYTQSTDIFRWDVLCTGVLTAIHKQSHRELSTCNATLTFYTFQILEHFGLQIIDSECSAYIGL